MIRSPSHGQSEGMRTPGETRAGLAEECGAGLRAAGESGVPRSLASRRVHQGLGASWSHAAGGTSEGRSPGRREGGGGYRAEGTRFEGSRIGRDLGDGPQGPRGERSREARLRGARPAAPVKDIAAEGRPPR